MLYLILCTLLQLHLELQPFTGNESPAKIEFLSAPVVLFQEDVPSRSAALMKLQELGNTSVNDFDQVRQIKYFKHRPRKQVFHTCCLIIKLKGPFYIINFFIDVIHSEDLDGNIPFYKYNASFKKLSRHNML